MIDWKCFFDQPIRNDMKTYNNIQKIATGQKDDNTTGCLLIYNYFKKPYYDSLGELSNLNVDLFLLSLCCCFWLIFIPINCFLKNWFQLMK